MKYRNSKIQSPHLINDEIGTPKRGIGLSIIQQPINVHVETQAQSSLCLSKVFLVYLLSSPHFIQDIKRNEGFLLKNKPLRPYQRPRDCLHAYPSHCPTPVLTL